jgi:hypothetical protein
MPSNDSEGIKDGLSNVDSTLCVDVSDVPTPASPRTHGNVAAISKYCSHEPRGRRLEVKQCEMKYHESESLPETPCRRFIETKWNGRIGRAAAEKVGSTTEKNINQ